MTFRGDSNSFVTTRFEIQRFVGRKSRDFYIPPVFWTSVMDDPVRIS